MVPIENVYEQIRTFAADAGARKVVLFGSRAKISSRAASLTSSSCSLSLVGNCSRRCWLMRKTLFPLPVPREMCSKPLFNITILWTNRCGCVCCVIAMILLISTMRNAPGVL